MQRVGRTLSVGLTAPILAFGGVALKSWDKQEKAIAQVNAGLISTGNAVGFTSEQLQKMASDLQNTSLFGDEEILQDAVHILSPSAKDAVIAEIKMEREEKKHKVEADTFYLM